MPKKSKKQYRKIQEADATIRPVTLEDTWCHFQKYENVDENAPYGHIIMIPNYKNGMKIDINGYVIKSRLFKGTLYLQVRLCTQPKEGDRYCLRIYKNHAKRTKHRKGKRYINITNTGKSKKAKFLKKVAPQR